MTVSPKQTSALSRLFSSSTIREMAGKGRSAAFARLAHEADAMPSEPRASRVRDVFDRAFAMLKQEGLRDEYIYKAALTHRILLGKHSLRTAAMLSEFRTGECKADIVILNGTTTVFEIKSERDSLTRLERQINSYRQVFASVFVIAGANHVDAVLDSTPPDVGVMSLDRRYYTSTHREAVNCPERISPLAVFGSLRTDEIASILSDVGVALPSVPNTQIRRALQPLFEGLQPRQVHDGMLRTLKRTRDLEPLAALVNRLPRSLHAAVLSMPLRRADHDRLVAAVNLPLMQAMAW